MDKRTVSILSVAARLRPTAPAAAATMRDTCCAGDNAGGSGTEAKIKKKVKEIWE